MQLSISRIYTWNHVYQASHIYVLGGYFEETRWLLGIVVQTYKDPHLAGESILPSEPTKN